MGTLEKDQASPHQQPHISSLVIRPSTSDGGEPIGGGHGGVGCDYEPGEVRRDRHPLSRTDRFKDDSAIAACKNLGLEEAFGYKTRTVSTSPVHRRDTSHRFSADIDQIGGPSHGRGRDTGHRYVADIDQTGGPFHSRGRGFGRHLDYSPSHSRGDSGGRPIDRRLVGAIHGPAPPFRGNGMAGNNPNVRPREGDWICSDPMCGNLNFARREYCNSCKRHRYASPPRRSYQDPMPLLPRRFPGPPMDFSPRRTMNSYRRSPRAWSRDRPQDSGPGAPLPLRHDPFQRDRLDDPDDDYRIRGRLGRPAPHWRKDGLIGDRKGYERRPPSPPLPLPPPQRGRWNRDARERSRSPIRGPPASKDCPRDVYNERGRDNRRAVARDHR